MEKDALTPETDQKPSAPQERPADWAEFDPRLNVQENDYIVTKRQWGAFFGTDLDLRKKLRRRGIDTIVLCGIATNIGVESTAREAFQYGYNQIFINGCHGDIYKRRALEATLSISFRK